jgi:pyridoxamine 5'-phosphate oxidase
MRVKEFAIDFSRDGLEESELDPDPFHQFAKWYEEAPEDGITTPNAMSLATASSDGMPSIRTVLLKLYDERGFVFFTNYGSNKARQINENPQAALLFPWISQGRQIIITGAVEKVPTSESLSYFLSRPRGSQIGAWASNQSSMISSRSVLEKGFEQIMEKFRNREVPLPDFWGGYRVKPRVFEFWQGRRNRLHDRFQYHDEGNGAWSIHRLSP